MAIVFDNAGGASYSASSSGSFSFNVAGKADRLMMVSAGYFQSGRNNFSTMSFNSVSMIGNLIGNVYQNSTVRINLFYLLAPDIGNHTLSWAVSGGTARVRVNVMSYFNVLQQAPIATQAAGGNSGNATINLSSTKTSWIIGGGHKQNSTSVSGGSGTSLREQASAGVGLGFSGDEIGVGGSQTFNFTLASNNWAIAAGVFEAALPKGAPIYFY